MDIENMIMPGTLKYDLDTPAFLIDLDLMEENIRKMASYFETRHADLRPHMKHHKTPVIAHKQIAAGAIGVCCQKLGEAEVMVEGGIRDILITYEVVGTIKIRRLMALCRQANMMVIVDDPHNVQNLSEAAQAFNIELGVLVDINTGQNRTGVEPGEPASTLATIVANCQGLQLRGICGYAGHIQGLEDLTERTEKDQEAMEKVMVSIEAMRKVNLPVDIVSAGGTGTYKLTGNHPEVTEVQAGSYVLMDAQYRRVLTDFESSGTVLASVISRPTPDRAVLDSGMKAISVDQWPPVVKSVEGVQISKVSDEHLVVTLTSNDARQLRPGDKVEIIPGHNDTTVNLHSHFFALRNGTLEAVWAVGARGKIR